MNERVFQIDLGMNKYHQRYRDQKNLNRYRNEPEISLSTKRFTKNLTGKHSHKVSGHGCKCDTSGSLSKNINKIFKIHQKFDFIAEPYDILTCYNIQFII